MKVKQSTAGTWTTAKHVNRPGCPAEWTAYDVPVSGSGVVSFDVQALVLNSETVNESVEYSHNVDGPSGAVKLIYDANGNRTGRVQTVAGGFLATTYDYDTDNLLTRIREWSNGVSQFDYQYTYDPFGRRIKAVEGGVTRYFVHDGLDCIAELDANKNLAKCYTRGLGLGGGIGDIIAEWRPNATNWYSYNHRGDVTLLTANNGRVTNRMEYTAFGSLSTINYQLSTRSIGFSSKEYDTKSGLSYYGFRYYDPASGRWMNKDPLFWTDHINQYVFVLNSPIQYTDLHGERTCCCSDGKEYDDTPVPIGVDIRHTSDSGDATKDWPHQWVEWGDPKYDIKTMSVVSRAKSAGCNAYNDHKVRTPDPMSAEGVPSRIVQSPKASYCAYDPARIGTCLDKVSAERNGVVDPDKRNCIDWSKWLVDYCKADGRRSEENGNACQYK